MEALRLSVGQAAPASGKPAKKPKKAASGQREMLMPIKGKKPAKETAAKKVRYQITPDPMRHLMTAVLPKRMVDKIIAKRSRADAAGLRRQRLFEATPGRALDHGP